MINLDFAFIIQLINFLVLVLVLNLFLYKPIRKILADRAEEMSGAKARTAAVDREVQEKVDLYEARLREVKVRASEERAAMIKEAQSEEASLVEKARKEAADSLAAVKNSVAREAAEARAFLGEQARSLSLEISEKVLGRSL